MMSQQIYRFKFSKEFSSKLLDFTKQHKFECPYDFKISWNKWIDKNTRIIEQEKESLILKGYRGDIYDKMYISVRYYYKLKNETNQVKKRKKYVAFGKVLLDIIDTDINLNVLKKKLKPSLAYNNFILNNNYIKYISNEQEKLVTINHISEDDFKKKLKKTYKNRYFLLKNKNN